MRTSASTSGPVVPTIPVQGLPTLPLLLDALRAASSPGPVLSVFLDTSPVRVEIGSHLLALRAGVKRLRAGGPSPAVEIGKHFEAAVTQVERYLRETNRFDHPGWACFASGDPSRFFATPLPHFVADAVIWSETPVTAPLEQALDEFERVVVLLFDAEESRLSSIFLGEIAEVSTFRDYVPSKHRGGGWFALDEAQQLRHREMKLLQHAHHTTKALLRELRLHPFDRLIIAGPDEPTSFLINQLPPVLAHRLIGTANIELFATQGEIRQAALMIAERAERAAETAEVGQLFDAATTGTATLGVDSVLAALADLRVRRLIIAADFDAHGAFCPRCERLMCRETCPICGDATTPVDDLREAIIAAAHTNGASLEFVSGPANDRLLSAGGVGAWTRF